MTACTHLNREMCLNHLFNQITHVLFGVKLSVVYLHASKIIHD